MRRSVYVVLALLLAADVGRAQQPVNAPPAGPGEVKGTIVEDKSGLAVARASVAIRSKANNALVAGALATPAGVFRVAGLRPGAYVLRVTSIGFTPKVQDIVITPAAPVVDAGTVRLARMVVNLQGVEVTEERSAVTVEADRNAYRAKDVAPAATNVSEVLDHVPSVQVDGDGKVSYRGNENVAVQINGRPSPITGAQLGAYLKTLPANIVERIEVIPNPSAKYDPEGMAGIINIVLKANTDLGLSGGLNVTGSRNRYNGSGNLGYQEGALTAFTTYGYNRTERPVLGINNRERFNSVSATTGYTEQDIASTVNDRGHNFTTTVDYKLTDRDVLTNVLTLNRRSSNEGALNVYTELDANRNTLDHYGRSRLASTSGAMVDYNLALKRTFEARKHELSAEVRGNRSHDQDEALMAREVLAPSTGTPTENERNATDAHFTQLNLQTDYTRPFLEGKLESGFKSTARWLDRDYAVAKDSLGTGTWTPSNLSNSFTFGERTAAAYGVFSRSVGKADLQAGLRGEYASREFSLAKPAATYPVVYRSLFPSGVISYALTDQDQVKASYSRRIRRPGTQELNPFPQFFDNQNVFLGNPNLAPEYTDAIELGYTRSAAFGQLQVAPFYRHTSNVIRVNINTSDVIDGRDVTSVSFQNLASSNSWGTDVNGSLRLGPKFSGFAGLNVFRMVTDGGSVTAVGSDAVTWSTRLNATSQFTPLWSVQGSWFYRAPMKIERGEFSSMQMVNASLRRKLDGDNLSVILRVSDPFNTGRMRILTGNGQVLQLTERSFGQRAVYLSLQYLYGQAPKIRVPQPEQPQQAPAGFP